MVAALDSKSSPARGVGSSPTSGTERSDVAERAVPVHGLCGTWKAQVYFAPAKYRAGAEREFCDGKIRRVAKPPAHEKKIC